MFERFTESARQVVVAGQDEARRLRHNYLSGEHLLLGLLSVEGVHRGVLLDHGLTVDVARERVREIVPPGDEVTTGQIPMTPRAKYALERGLREALSMGHNYIAPFHVLLGLQADPREPGADEGVARRILREAGASPELVIEAIARELDRGREEPRPVVGAHIRFEGAPPPRTRGRCEQAFTLYGALFVCQRETGHGGDHVEHGDGWTTRWQPE